MNISNITQCSYLMHIIVHQYYGRKIMETKIKKKHSRTRYYIKLLLEIFNKKQEKSQVALHKNKLTVDLFLFQSAFGQRNH